MRSVLLALVALFLLSPASQAAEPGPSSPTGGAQRIRLVVPLEPLAPFDQAIADIVKDFNSTHSDFHVEITKGGGPFENLRSIIAAHYANDLPDMAIINTADVTTLDGLNIVQPLPSSWIAAKKINPAFLPRKCQNGEACALPFQRQVPVWYYNRELLFKLGQDTDHIPTSWNKLAAFARRYYKQSELWAVAVPESGESAIARWTALGLAPSLTAESLVEWVERIWENQGIWLPGNPTPEEVTRLFLEQRAVVMLGTLDQAAFLKSNAAFRIGSALPEGSELAWFGNDIVVLAKGRNAELARKFLDHLYRPDVSVRIFKAANTFPITHPQSDDAAWRKELASLPLIRAALARKPKPLGLEKIVPQSREDISRTVWDAVEAVPEENQRGAKAGELKLKLQKKLSTNPR